MRWHDMKTPFVILFVNTSTSTFSATVIATVSDIDM